MYDAANTEATDGSMYFLGEIHSSVRTGVFVQCPCFHRERYETHKLVFTSAVSARTGPSHRIKLHHGPMGVRETISGPVSFLTPFMTEHLFHLALWNHLFIGFAHSLRLLWL